MPVLPYLVALIGVLIMIAGLLAVAVPGLLRDKFALFQNDRLLAVGVGGRIVLGLFFLVASEACSWPLAIGTIGVVAVAVGFVGAFLGFERLKALMGWFLARSNTVFRAWAGLAIVLGVFIVYAAL